MTKSRKGLGDPLPLGSPPQALSDSECSHEPDHWQDPRRTPGSPASPQHRSSFLSQTVSYLMLSGIDSSFR